MVFEEAVLYYRLGDSEVMAAQPGYLLTAGARCRLCRSAASRCLPASVPCGRGRRSTCDDALVSVGLISDEVNITPPEIALYTKAFEQLRGITVYGRRLGTWS